MLHAAIYGEIGYLALLAAFVVTFFQFALPLCGVLWQREHWQRLSSSLAYAQALALLISFTALAMSFYAHDFSLSYVATSSNSLLPWYYKLSATWSGHEGSLLLWALILAVWGALVAWFGRLLPLTMRASVLSVLAAVQLAILALVIFSSSPFERSLPHLPVDGADLNPLLQDVGLIFHPPILYIGYVGMAVPFAFAVAALWVGRLDAAWTRWTRPWALAAWAFLTLGIAVGSWWAYYELGWGGWWFWDPVENASLMPWLAATALLHALATTEKRGVFKAWTVLLAILVFALSLLGTFLVRSGVLTSVHSFAADPERGLFILIVMAVLIGSALLLFAMRGWKLTAESRYALHSRESLLAVNNMLLLVATVVVFLGTLYPIIAEGFGLGQVSVGSPYYNAMFVPLTWLLLLFLGLAPIIRWKKHTKPLLGAGIAIGVTAFVLGLVVTFIITGKLVSAYAVSITLVLSFWVLLFMLKDIKDKTRHAASLFVGLKRLRLDYWAMHLAHLGVLVLCVGVGFTSAMSVEKDVALKVGESVRIAKAGIFHQQVYYQFTLAAVQQKRVKNYQTTMATFHVHEISQQSKRQLPSLYPEKRLYLVQKRPMTEAAVSATLWRDLYVALGEPLDQQNPQAGWAVRVHYKPFVRWLWLGAVLMALAGFLAMLDKRHFQPIEPKSVRR